VKKKIQFKAKHALLVKHYPQPAPSVPFGGLRFLHHRQHITPVMTEKFKNYDMQKQGNES
jgi:hypothetical protein